jgi:hypothetical protein
MASSEHLLPEWNKALEQGRAIPMLVDHRPDELPDHTLTVIGLIDTKSFVGVFLPDDFQDGPLVRVKIPSLSAYQVSTIRTDSADAQAIHELWSQWNSGARASYITFVRSVALSLALVRLEEALQAALPVEEPKGEPKPSPAGAGAKRKTRARRSPGKKQSGPKRQRKDRGHTS